MKNKICLYCNKNFTCHNWENRKYCSRYCAGKQNNNCFISKSWTKKKTNRIAREIVCVFCNISTLTTRKKYCSQICSQKSRWEKSKNTHKISRKNRGLNRKNQMIIYKGGKCENCGYNKCIRALTFHHKNKKEKSFTLDQRNMSQKPFVDIQKEVDKCSLLCFNCHMEYHHNN